MLSLVLSPCLGQALLSHSSLSSFIGFTCFSSSVSFLCVFLISYLHNSQMEMESGLKRGGRVSGVVQSCQGDLAKPPPLLSGLFVERRVPLGEGAPLDLAIDPPRKLSRPVSVKDLREVGVLMKNTWGDIDLANVRAFSL